MRLTDLISLIHANFDGTKGKYSIVAPERTWVLLHTWMLQNNVSVPDDGGPFKIMHVTYQDYELVIMVNPRQFSITQL